MKNNAKIPEIIGTKQKVINHLFELRKMKENCF